MTLDFLDRPIAFNRAFVTITGNIAAALMLSQANYWRKRTKDPEGWFFKTQMEWTEETGMKRSDLETAKKILINRRFMDFKVKGLPAKSYYKLNVDIIGEALMESFEELSIDRLLAIYGNTLLDLSKGGVMRAAKLNLPHRFVDYREIIKTCGLICHICEHKIIFGPGMKSYNLCFDHVIPLSKGGSHFQENIKPAHCFCNIKKGDLVPSISLFSSIKIDFLDKTNRTVMTNKTSSIGSIKHSLNTETTSETTSETEVNVWPTFKDFFNAYGKRINEESCKDIWAILTHKEKIELMEHVALYINSTPVVKFRKNPLNYLKEKSWMDEIISSNQTPVSKTSPNDYV